jgi:hypothetical protein
MEGDDVQAIRRTVDEMQRAAQAAQAGAQPGSGGQSARGTGPDVAEGEVIDAEPVEH